MTFQVVCASRPGLLGTSLRDRLRINVSRRKLLRPPAARRLSTRAEQVQEKQPVVEEPEADVERVTKKWGLEAGLFKAMTSKQNTDGKSSGQTAKDLLKKYGSAYLITSISFALISFAVCYLLVDIGVDVSALLGKIGIKVSGTGEKVGTAAIAYAAHKAASPIRFPPTVALTPVVANWLGRKEDVSNVSEPQETDE